MAKALQTKMTAKFDFLGCVCHAMGRSFVKSSPPVPWAASKREQQEEWLLEEERRRKEENERGDRTEDEPYVTFFFFGRELAL